ncbi:MAG: Tricorn protease [Myxococcota bacterium]|nr:Tricorn protease [Myxococcota bacterium]
MSKTARASAGGYYRFPAIHNQTVVFVSEDDLWTVPLKGGAARRLTSGLGGAAYPVISPDGQTIAFTGEEEGNTEVYVMPADGGPAQRLTYQGAGCRTAGWTPDGGGVVYVSTARQPFPKIWSAWEVPLWGGDPRPLNLGPASFFAYGPKRGEGRHARVLTRFQDDPARWKRYRGGTAGVIWVDTKGDGDFRPLIELKGNLVRGMWVGDEIVFLSDHEGVGNLYACTPQGKKLRRLAHHTRFYARHPQTDGQRVVYHSGGDLWAWEPGAEARKINVRYGSPRTWRNRKFVPAAGYLEEYDLHPRGHELMTVARGKVFTMGLWEGGVRQHGAPHGVRHRLAAYSKDGDTAYVIRDGGAAEELHAIALTPKGINRNYGALDFGRPVSMLLSPDGKTLALSNHRYEAQSIDLESGRIHTLDASDYGRIQGMAWSPDSKWISYGFPTSIRTSVIRMASPDGTQLETVTSGEFRDHHPSFDPKGRYLYFISFREFDPVYDSLRFDLGFPRGMRLCALLLRKDAADPFVPQPRPLKGKGGDKPGDKDKPGEGEVKAGESSREKKAESPASAIDFEGVEKRVLAFPVPEGRYGSIQATENLVFFSSHPIEGSLNADWLDPNPAPTGALKAFDLTELETRDVASGISSFWLASDQQTLIIRAGRKLRVTAASLEGKPLKEESGTTRKSGWLDLGRISVEVDPGQEWRQMLREAHRLMAQHFWTADMSGVDWNEALDRYQPLVDRIGSRQEFSDLMWEFQGELGSSHAYEMGGDHRAPPPHRRGFLGAETFWDESAGGYRVSTLIHGDEWDPKHGSPLARAGSGVAPGDVIVALGGRTLSREYSLDHALVDRAGDWVDLTVRPGGGGEPETVTVKALHSELNARYRDWVNTNRRVVHERGGGQVGYIHIPNMGPAGYAEFNRGFLAGLHRPALIVDVRFNGGGHVSQLLIEKLLRKRVMWDRPRWGAPVPYPEESPAGPLVALTNEQAGSDGDIFSHVWKVHGLGPLIGKRTWGGVIGIWPRHELVDGGVTTQPEFCSWFMDVGFGVENYGVDPSIEVEITPADHARNHDPQLDKAVEQALMLLRKNPPAAPEFRNPPNLRRPRLKGVEK